MSEQKVFISHSSADAPLAAVFQQALEAAGIPCWIAPRDVPYGAPYMETLVKAIDGCGVFMLVFSEHVGASVPVASEIERAASKERPIFLVRIDDADPRASDSISFYLGTRQWFDAAGLAPEQYLPRLVEGVRAIVEQSASGKGAVLSPAEAAETNGLSSIAGGVDLERMGDWDEATRRYEELLDSSSEHVRCLTRIRLARCLIETCNSGETHEARERLEQAEAMPVVRADAVLRGELRLQQGRLETLRARSKQALDRFEQAREALAEGGAELAEVDLALAAAERDRGEFTKSLDRLNGLDAGELPSWLRAEYFDELGATLLARGEAPEAIREIEKGLELDNETGNAYAGSRSKLLLAEAYMRTGAPDYAAELIQQAMDACREESATGRLSEAFAVRGSWYEDREEYSEAIQAYLESYDLDRDSGDSRGQLRAKRNLARVYRKQGRSDRALELLNDARELLTAGDDVEKAAILREEGHLALSGSDLDYDEAIGKFQEALDTAVEDDDDRTIALAKRDLAAAYVARQKFEPAEALLLEAREALDRRGDLRELDDLLDDLAELKLDADDYPQARLYALESLEYDEQLGRVASKARSLLLLGRIESRSPDQDAAGDRFEDACELYRRARNDVGLADALKYFGAWQLAQGRIEPAVASLREALEIETSLGRRLGRVQAKRLLTAAMRQRGSLDRALDYLEDAQRDIEGIKDPSERALLDFEEARVELVLGDHPRARRLLKQAQATLLEEKSPVDAATCQRFLALVSAYEGRYAEALSLLDEARRVFVEFGDHVELDELYDDLGIVHLLRGDPTAAEAAVKESLELGQRSSWGRGSGRSLVLLAKVALQRRDRPAAWRHLEDALALYERIGDEVGQATVLVELGDWHAAAGVPGRTDPNDAKAVEAYKKARRLLQHHRNRRGVARCNRKLALVYLDRGEIQRADEAIKDAEADLDDVRDLRELAPLEFALGRLAAANNDHDGAIDHLRQALDGFKALGQNERRSETHRLLVHSYQAQGDMKSALDCIRQMETERVSMYDVLVDELDDAIAQAAGPSFSNGLYAAAVDRAFGALEHDFRLRVKELGGEVRAGAPITDHISAWGELAPVGDGQFLEREAVAMFARFCSATFDVVRSVAYRGLAEQPSEAFAALSIAHWIARSLESLDAHASDTERSTATV